MSSTNPPSISHSIDGDDSFTFTRAANSQLSDCVTWKAYYANTERVQKSGAADEVYTHLKDNIDSTSRVVKNSDMSATTLRYGVWGEARSAAINTTSTTDLLYTGQEKSSYINLYWYDSRWFDPYLNRWLQPDSIIPDIYNPLDLDRYSYVRNNPVNFNDPSGHDVGCPGRDASMCSQNNIFMTNFGIKIDQTQWSEHEIGIMRQSFFDLRERLSDGTLKQVNKDISLEKSSKDIFTRIYENISGSEKDGSFFAPEMKIDIYDSAFSGEKGEAQITLYHEIGHVIEARDRPSLNSFQNKFWTNCGSNCPNGIPASSYGRTGPEEDFAESFSANIYYKNRNNENLVGIFLPDNDRDEFVDDWIKTHRK